MPRIPPCALAVAYVRAHDAGMIARNALFPRLLGADWDALAAPVRRMHGDAPRVVARGMADVEGAAHLLARGLRRVLGLPQPGPRQALEVTIERDGTREVWTRRFAGACMRSTLDLDGDALRERLGPASFRFALHRDGGDIDWRLRRMALLGVPLPRALCGSVVSRSGVQDGRYAFRVEVRMPLVGRLVAYRGGLEIVDGE